MASSLVSTLVGRSAPGWELSVVRNDDAPARDAALADLGEPELVAACLAGRPGACDIIVERHPRSVYQLCYRLVGNHEDASDLSQDVFRRPFRGHRTLKRHSPLAPA